METLAEDLDTSQPVPKPKKVITRAQLNELTLLNESKGLKRLYTECQKVKPTGNCKQDLHKLLNLYREWHFGLAPKFEFNFFVQKCQVLGTKAPIKVFMTRLRKIHSGTLTWEELENREEEAADLEKEVDAEEQLERININDETTVQENKKVEKQGEVEEEVEELGFFEELEEEIEENEDELEYLREMGIETGETKRNAIWEEDEIDKKVNN